ncbi:hypothetical protein EHI8A_125520 [Entamoeba histolytica HM-1:IMSS-B]|uniref:RING-type domain-containing protein n=6 Tax=Entamoeba histolytica TaxID=5759 RepID=C4M9D6_ENTH1|nr:hypothetical protein EHI_091470 [Entamoeba histolytica HM-1:IMSS]EMD42806.1 Hypothetical protein EHI5A_044220 [Entamoeba histolytica KU27]EMH72552.1 hypothetical protein EHI8A_125520 [Entamoeba histolytica HM-1:IMSS-B]ENY62562.1 hypothetical protein EHI7A_117950 [Entamoeba histolytica HM-1:IMSS-A]GAT98273.1 hypothetical protein CL6EHI_091470 [Entamoeba histolytica]EAL45012.2 hypothetical protein EHI_091470 [Entamoeba histolytica HM-1:IMSS]|eukprot:XP_650398.2 hypothetical protein EHI_091470 [Entamoeba histolytica HM-1:IMSS]
MGITQSIPFEEQIPNTPPTEMEENQPDVPLVNAQIKHVVLYCIDKMTLHVSNGFLHFLIDCAIEAHLEAYTMVEGQKKILETKELPAQMQQEVSIPNISNILALTIDITKSVNANIPLTEYILIDSISVTILLTSEVPKISSQQFHIGDVTYNSFDVFGVDSDDVTGTDNLCVICTTDPREILLLPCRHITMCAGCYEEVKERTHQCPICRTPITAAINFSRKSVTPKDDATEIEIVDTK